MSVVYSLFSGIGGLDEGLRRAGWEHAFFCESDEYRRRVLAARFPGVPIFDDVATLDFPARQGGLGAGGGALGVGLGERSADRGGCELSGARVDLLCGGVPCQDVSVAGRRAGLAGRRSGLFFELARIADALRPRWLLIENVPGLLASNGGRDFGSVLGTLADIGYGLAWRTLDSRFFGVPQRRRRVFIIGALADGDPRAAAERAGQVLAIGTRCNRHPATRTKARENAAVASLSGLGNGGADDNDGQAGRLVTGPLLSAKASGWRGDDHEVASKLYVARTLVSEGADGSEDGTGRGTPLVATSLSHGSNPNSNAAGRRREDDENLVVGRGVRRLMPIECERLQGFLDGWTQLGDTPESRRYAALGDAVTVSVAEWIGRRILAYA